MERSKKIILVAHCILNSNAKVEGLAIYKGVLKDLVRFFMDADFGIIQLPCMETIVYGIKRWGHVKEQFDSPFFRKQCRHMLEPIVDQIVDYHQNGYHIAAVIGIDGSPSCGVSITCSSKLWGGEVSNQFGLQEKMEDLRTVEDQGVFMEELKKLLHNRGIDIPFLAIDEADSTSSIIKIQNYFKGEI